MDIRIKPYSFNTIFEIKASSSITSILPEQVETVRKIFETVFDKAEDEIEKQLYEQGLMTCNAMLFNIDEMKENGNYLVKDYIKELETKYNK